MRISTKTIKNANVNIVLNVKLKETLELYVQEKTLLRKEITTIKPKIKSTISHLSLNIKILKNLFFIKNYYGINISSRA
jgi:hypothetical protein